MGGVCGSADEQGRGKTGGGVRASIRVDECAVEAETLAQTVGACGEQRGGEPIGQRAGERGVAFAHKRPCRRDIVRGQAINRVKQVM